MEITLEKRLRKHVITFWERTQNEEIRRLFPFSVESLEKTLELYEESLNESAKSYGKAICADGRHIGDIWCYGIDIENEHMAMLSIVIFENVFWGKGIAKSATTSFLHEVFNKYDIDKIGAFTYSFNIRSVKALIKSGFIEIERFLENGIESIYLEVTR